VYYQLKRSNTVISEHRSPSEDKEGHGVRWYFNHSTEEVVNVSVAGEFTSAQRQSVVHQRYHHPVQNVR